MLSEFCHNIAQGKHKSILWMRGDTPDILLRKAGAIDVHYSAKEELNRVIQAIAMEIAKKAAELSYANSAEKGIVWDSHIIEAIKMLGRKSLRDILINYCEGIEEALERHKKHERIFPEVEMKKMIETLEYEIERMKKWFE